MTRAIIFLTVFSLLFVLPCRGQSAEGTSAEGMADDYINLKKITLLSELKSLEDRAASLTKPLAKAAAAAEIADAAWELDVELAKELLREAYELTFPPEEEQERLRNIPAGAIPRPPSANSRARDEVRKRVLSIARRDQNFADELMKLGAERLGKYEEHYGKAVLADKAIKAGDKESAGRYILESTAADPSQMTAGHVILDLAAQDRPAADRIILQYLRQLRGFPLSIENQSALRTYYILGGLVFPDPASDRQRRRIPSAGPEVIKAYVTFVVESIKQIEGREPGSAQRLRGFLLGVWPPLRQYAPELTGEFLSLERISRGPGQSASLPDTPAQEAFQKRREKQIADALNDGQPDEYVINSAISKGDFVKARKLLDKLSDSPVKGQLLEAVNVQEALSLTAKGDLPGAGLLAERLTNAASVLQVYPAMIERCVAKKDQACAMNLAYQATRQLKKADTAPAAAPAGIPASAMANSQEFDPVVMSLGKLAISVAPMSETLALEILDETVGAANRSIVDTAQGRTGFDPSIFRTLAPKNETRVLQAANDLKDTLRQITALAAIYQWKAKDLMKKASPSSK